MSSWFRCCPSGLGPGSVTGRSMESGWSSPGLGGLWPFGASMAFLDAFSVLFHSGTSFSRVKAFLTGCRGLTLTSYRVGMENRSEWPLRAFWRHVRWKAWGRNAVDEVKENPTTARWAIMGGSENNRNPVSHTRTHKYATGCGGTPTHRLCSCFGSRRRRLIVADTHVRGAKFNRPFRRLRNNRGADAITSSAM